ncbi:hypothetical protein Hypma_016330 [Hypsizygus marmoreus]|uniref:Thioesterase-like superfamily-domain-containing protein n=1 Tax=Hypsizygus marmoreus TaxID=39966 RepID=A0A369J332_HYPMA|nr:hypothetical protein Hypma_016330 [Hypsizygus marmoreus]
MAPFYRAVDVKSSPSNDAVYRIFAGDIDPQWLVGAVPNGGYVLALIVEAAIQYQAASTSGHKDPIHVTAHYLRTTSVAHFEVRVRTLKTGRGFTNLTAELIQQGNLIVTTHLIFGINTPTPPPHLTLVPPSPYARRIPLHTHPSTANPQRMREAWVFQPYMKLASDPTIHARNHPESISRTDSTTVGGGGLEWGAWFEFVDEGDRITNPSLAFLVDIFVNLPSLLPKSERQGLRSSWFPTMVLAIEFKAPIPRPSDVYASRTVGLYSSGRFLNDGRHDAYVEVWSAPCNIGEGVDTEGWREKQVCLATATQMAYIVPMEVNMAKGKKGSAKL